MGHLLSKDHHLLSKDHHLMGGDESCNTCCSPCNDCTADSVEVVFNLDLSCPCVKHANRGSVSFADATLDGYTITFDSVPTMHDGSDIEGPCYPHSHVYADEPGPGVLIPQFLNGTWYLHGFDKPGNPTPNDNCVGTGITTVRVETQFDISFGLQCIGAETFELLLPAIVVRERHDVFWNSGINTASMYLTLFHSDWFGDGTDITDNGDNSWTVNNTIDAPPDYVGPCLADWAGKGSTIDINVVNPPPMAPLMVRSFSASLTVPGEIKANPKPTLSDGSKLWDELHQRALAFTGDIEREAKWLTEYADRLPCGPCKTHWRKIVEENPPDYARYFEWTVERHNDVNRNLGKREVTADEAKAIVTLKGGN